MLSQNAIFFWRSCRTYFEHICHLSKKRIIYSFWSMYLSFRIWLLSISVRFFDLFSKRIAIWYFQFKIRFSPNNWIFYFWYFRIHILTPLVFMFGLCCTRICPYCGYCAYWNFLKKGEFIQTVTLAKTEIIYPENMVA